MAASRKKPETPTRIRSDVIDIKRNSQTIDFFDNVVVEKDDSSLLAQKMTVFYEEKDKKPSSKKKNQDSEPVQGSSIKRINAEKNVKIFSEDFVASGDFGYYDPKKDIFVLEQNVIVNNGTSIASGAKFVYSLQTKKGNFVGTKNETSIGSKNADDRVVVIIGDEVKDDKDQYKKKKQETDSNKE